MYAQYTRAHRKNADIQITHIVQIHTNKYAHTSIYTYTYTRASTQTHTHTNTHTHTYIYIYNNNYNTYLFYVISLIVRN